jgi:ABC-type sugar transport system ATPase subunit
MTVQKPLLAMRRIRKRFGNLEVLHDVDLTLEAGNVLVLAGANGAGKSTLVKILAGVYSDWEGTIEIEGNPVRPRRPQDATALGVACIHQELSLVGPMSVADNLFLGRERCRWWRGVDYRNQEALSRTWLARLGLDLDVNHLAEEYPIAIRQLIEVARALSKNARILVMDEPTSALTETETQHLFQLIEELKGEGRAVLFISHKMEEIYRVADQISVLRDGAMVGTRLPSELPEDELVEWMAGRRLEQHEKATSLAEELALSVEGLTVPNPSHPDRPWVSDVTFEVKKGEVLGLAGLAGSGASETLGGVFGRFPRTRGKVTVVSESLPLNQPMASLKKGLALLTNDRKADGLTLTRSVIENVTLASLPRFSPYAWLRPKKERTAVQEIASDFELQAPKLDSPVSTLSGGNQQKSLLARLWLTDPRVLLLDEPTRGIDVTAKAKVHRLIDTWTRAGCAIVLTSSELPELLALCDRVLVLHRGRIQAEYRRSEASAEKVLTAALGGGAS